MPGDTPLEIMTRHHRQKEISGNSTSFKPERARNLGKSACPSVIIGHNANAINGEDYEVGGSATEIVLTQKRVHKSIRGLAQTTLPAFTVLTGINGSGKSHLMEAITTGAITNNLDADPTTDIGSFDWNSLVPNNAALASITKVHSHRDWFIKQVRARKVERLPHLQTALTRYGIDSQYASRPWTALDASESDLIQFGVSPQSSKQILGELRQFENDIRSNVNSAIKQDIIKQGLYETLVSEGQDFHLLDYSDFDRRAFASYGPSLFQQSFSELFFGYFDKQRTNLYGEIAISRGMTPSVMPLKPDEFVAKHGQPPWDFVNNTLERARLDFRIDQPVDFQATEYMPRLTKLSTGDEVEFSALSSGEKILMSFAFCLYNSTDSRQSIKRPKLLLFDEIDAPIHPSMSRVLVNIINDVLVVKEGIPVIMVTHAPSTVAVAPDESIHLVTPNPTRITKESKRRAVSVLTAEIPTMSIDFSGRRQVLVESDYDAERYQALFQILAPFLKSERSLSFIGVGHASMNTGCAQVIKTVTALEAAQNTSVLGLIDWDTENQPTSRVHVLGHQARYSIENYILDPLLLAATILSENPGRSAFLGLDPTDTFATFGSLPKAKLQGAHDVVQMKVLAVVNDSEHEDVVQTTYLGGEILNADRRYHLAQGHKLEEFVKAAFPELKRFHQTGQLLLHIVKNVVRNHPKLVPVDVTEALLKLCDADL